MIINPLNPTHTLRVVPRYNPTGVLLMTLKDTTRDTEEFITIDDYTQATLGGIEFSFAFTSIDETRYQATIVEDTRDAGANPIVYRGIIIATAQDTQSYLLTKDKYYY